MLIFTSWFHNKVRRIEKGLGWFINIIGWLLMMSWHIMRCHMFKTIESQEGLKTQPSMEVWVNGLKARCTIALTWTTMGIRLNWIANWFICNAVILRASWSRWLITVHVINVMRITWSTLSVINIWYLSSRVKILFF